ncbi:MAG: HAD family hydrolase [Pseudonocardiaceae bacterium]
MERPRLVVSDVDGTLLDPTERISERTRAVVRRVVEAGVPFVLATGRPPRWISPITAQLGHADLTICANGAVLYDAAADRVIEAVTLDTVMLCEAVDAVATALPAAKLGVERAGSAAVDGAHQFLAEPGYTHPWPGGDAETAPRDELLDRPATKLLARQAGASSDAMARAVAQIVGDAVGVTFSTGQGLIEICAPGVTKGTGLAVVAWQLGIEAADVIAIGDMPNDLPMLHWAGCGVAMANAHPAVLDAADEVTAPNTEDGLALVLERWF